MDVIVVDEVYCKLIGCLYLILVIDVFSWVVVGLYVMFDVLLVMLVVMCIFYGMNIKSDYLCELGVEGDWLVWG